MIFKNRFMALALGCCAIATALAIPANPKPVKIKQPDGTEITIRIHGDEHHHWLTDATTGHRVVCNADGFYVEVPNADREAQQTGLQTSRHAPQRTPQRIGRPQSGNCNYLVVLVDFADVRMTFKRDDFDRWLNVDGYYGTGSVKQYWNDNSGGKFCPEFTVVGPYSLPHKTSYYGAPDKSTGDYDINPREMVIGAIQAAKADHPELDFSQFDNDQDGEMDNCYIIYAGYSQASTGADNDIWPHSWYLGDESLMVDGVKVFNYSCSQELVGNDRLVKKMDGIGTFTHEFGHVLGLRDLYDTDDYDHGIGIHPGGYSLYASGSYNNDSRTPAALWAFERNQMGWLEDGELLRLQGDMDVTLGHFISSGQAAYIDCQPGLSEGKEWIVFENRQKTGWDEYLPSHGLLAYHYDYTTEMREQWWDINGPNSNAQHPCLYILAADGTNSDTNREYDTWPGMTGATRLDDTTTPSTRNWHDDPMMTPLSNIREDYEGLVHFQVGKGVHPWDVIRAERPTHIRADRADITTEFHVSGDIMRYGLLWSKGRDVQPTIKNVNILNQRVLSPDAEGRATTTIQNLSAGAWYTVCPYVMMSDRTVVYGSAITFQTDYKLAEAPFVEYFGDDYNADYHLPNRWEIVDNNNDGTTWQLSESDNAIFYEFDYWNDADDWLISRRQWRVPEHGLLTFTRGVSNTTTREGLEVYISTGERRVEDFVLQERFSFANFFDDIVYESVDLSAFAGQDVYVALRCTSEKLQDALFLFSVALTQKLGTPTVTRFGAVDAECRKLTAEWTEIPGANKYYLWFAQVTSALHREVVFVPVGDWLSLTGDVTALGGGLTFTGNGQAQLRTYPDGINDLNFVVFGSGPSGKSQLLVEGTVDGQQWTPVGPRIDLSSYDSEGQEVMWGDYIAGQHYISLRFTLEHGGRNCRIKYLTLDYYDGPEYETLAAGSVTGKTSAQMYETHDGQFRQGTYVVTVAAGDDAYFYDESPIVSYSYATSGIRQITADEALSLGNAQITDLLGREVGQHFHGIVLQNGQLRIRK